MTPAEVSLREFIESRIDGLETRIEDRFDRVDDRFDRVENQAARIEVQTTKHNGRMTTIEKWQIKVDAALGRDLKWSDRKWTIVAGCLIAAFSSAIGAILALVF